jgi:hypothetical protein
VQVAKLSGTGTCGAGRNDDPVKLKLPFVQVSLRGRSLSCLGRTAVVVAFEPLALRVIY